MRVPDLIVRVISSAWIATTIIIKPRAGTVEGDARQLLFLLKGVHNFIENISVSSNNVEGKKIHTHILSEKVKDFFDFLFYFGFDDLLCVVYTNTFFPN